MGAKTNRWRSRYKEAVREIVRLENLVLRTCDTLDDLNGALFVARAGLRQEQDINAELIMERAALIKENKKLTSLKRALTIGVPDHGG